MIIVSTKKQLKNIPIVFNVDFGHVFPFATFPIGGLVRVNATETSILLEVVKH